MKPDPGSCFGVVKWFGGYDRKKQKENDFGFCQTIDGSDVYINKAMLDSEAALSEGDLVIIKNSVKSDRKIVKEVSKEKDGPLLCYDIFIGNEAKFLSAGKDEKFLSSTVKTFCYTLYRGGYFNVNNLISEEGGLEKLHSFLSFLFDSSYGRGLDKDSLLKKIFKGADPLLFMQKGLEKKYISSCLFNKDMRSLLERLNIIDEDEKNKIIEIYICELPGEFLLLLIADRSIDGENLPSSQKRCIITLLKGIFNSSGKSKNHAAIKSAANSIFSSKKPAFICDLIELCLLKKNMFEKKMGFYSYLLRTPALMKQVDAQILGNVLYYYSLGNAPEDIIKIVVSDLWKGIAAHGEEYLSQPRVLSLFPSCSVMGEEVVNPFGNGQLDDEDSLCIRKQLSCEAVYWKKANVHLCRGKKCFSPSVYPNRKNKHYLDYSIYDWLDHYGIDYFEGGIPSRQDFPIKLAGYLNRLREILERIKCRACGVIMEPNLSYARVTYLDFSNGKVEEKEMSAAYRATVFRCGSEQCSQKGRNVYINHCISFGCYDTIDSRDSKVKCDSGRYVCRSCGGCCEIHAKSRPVGICPECGSSLQLYEDIARRRKFEENKNLRFVVCENKECGFTINDPLPKRFYLDSCSPVFTYDSRSGPY